jgi:hypothetical protein
MVFVGAPDNKTVQKNIGDQFDDNWRRGTVGHVPAFGGNSIRGGESPFFMVSGELNADHAAALQAKTATLYVLSRWVWTDSTGTWASDSCQGYEDMKLTVLHKCDVHDRQRYPFHGRRTDAVGR